MATTTKTRTRKGFPVGCPFCGSEEYLSLAMHDVTKCVCGDCDREFAVAEAVEKAAENARAWRAVLAWVGMAPEYSAD